MNIDITEEDSKYMYGFVQGIIEEVGPRMPCSPQEANAAEIIKNEFSQNTIGISLEKSDGNTLRNNLLVDNVIGLIETA